MFNPARFTATPTHLRIYKLYECLYTLVDFSAGALFVTGSIFFFYPSLVYAGTWMFLIGSILFAARPTVRLLRELHLARVSTTPGTHTSTRAGI